MRCTRKNALRLDGSTRTVYLYSVLSCCVPSGGDVAVRSYICLNIGNVLFVIINKNKNLSIFYQWAMATNIT